MSVEIGLRELAQRLQGMPAAGFTERETERYLVEPFIDALGYDSRNPSEVQAQLPIQIGSTTRNCDYAIKLHGEVRVLIECKRANVSLDSPNQLASYFSQVSTALLGIYTNGLEYRFYAERNQGRVKQMDSDPFLILSLRDLDQTAISRITLCSKNQFSDVDGFQRWVTDLRYTRVVQERLRRELMGQPSDELVSLAMQWADVEEKTPERINQFRIILKEAAHSILHLAPQGGSQVAVKSMPQARDAPQPSQSMPIGWLPLDELVRRLENQGVIGHGEMRKNAPRVIRFSDGQQAEVGSWLQIAMETAYWLWKKELLNLDNCEIQDAVLPKRRILSAEASHPDGRLFRYGGKPIRDTGIKIDTQRSGLHFTQNTCMLLEHFGQDPSQVSLKLP